MKIKNLATILVVLAVITIPNISGAQGGYNYGSGYGNNNDTNEVDKEFESFENELRDTEAEIEKLESEEEDNGTSTESWQDDDSKDDMDEQDDEDATGTDKMSQERERAQERMSDVASFVQAMEKVATRNKGIGEQVRVIAQNQNNIQEEVEDALQEALERKGFTKFLIGPNYGKLKDVEDRLELHTKNLEELKALREQVTNTSDKAIIDEQIAKMEEIRVELEKAVSEEQSGFSLFGWLNKILAK